MDAVRPGARTLRPKVGRIKEQPHRLHGSDRDRCPDEAMVPDGRRAAEDIVELRRQPLERIFPKEISDWPSRRTELSASHTSNNGQRKIFTVSGIVAVLAVLCVAYAYFIEPRRLSLINTKCGSKAGTRRLTACALL